LQQEGERQTSPPEQKGTEGGGKTYLTGAALLSASGRGLSNVTPFEIPLKLNLCEKKNNNLVICKT
jgi:hypothetical protein